MNTAFDIVIFGGFGDLALRKLLPRGGQLCLEVGAGAGRLTDELQAFGRVVLLDYSRTQLQQAQAQAYQSYLQDLRTKAKIEIFDESLKGAIEGTETGKSDGGELIAINPDGTLMVQFPLGGY